MEIIPKLELTNGSYYEGIINETDAPVIAKWNEQTNCFEYALHHWTAPVLVTLSYWDEFQENLDSFCPYSLVFPKEYDLVENL